MIKEADLENDELQDLNYASTSEEKKETSKKINNENFPIKMIDISDEDEILMCSFYLPLNIVKKENGDFNLIPTNDPLTYII